MRRPGIEPGSTAWKAAMLTTIPPTLSCWNDITDPYSSCTLEKVKQKSHCRDQDSNLGYCGHNAGS